jgi:hypothetical protein
MNTGVFLMITNLSVVCGKPVTAFLIALVAFGREVISALLLSDRKWKSRTQTAKTVEI